MHAGTVVSNTTFRPFLKDALLVCLFQLAVLFVHVSVVTQGWQESQVLGVACIMIASSTETGMMLNVYYLEKHHRYDFLHKRWLEHALQEEREAQPLRSAIAHERGRAQAERTIVAFLCHEVQYCWLRLCICTYLLARCN
jgi:hypothetical protein